MCINAAQVDNRFDLIFFEIILKTFWAELAGTIQLAFFNSRKIVESLPEKSKSVAIWRADKK